MDQDTRELVARVARELHAYDAAREALNRGAHTSTERQRVHAQEDAFGEALLALIDDRVARALGGKSVPGA